MAVVDTLEVLIEANSRGLESQLKSTGNTIKEFISTMNRQEVNWTQILSRTISPAIISGIASTFAIAITSALNFQNTLVKSGDEASQGFNANTAQITQGVTNIAATTGQSMTEVAQAFGIVNGVFKDTSVAQGILNDLSQIATIRGMDLLSVVNALVPVLQNWGITTIPEANEALAALNESTQLGTINFNDLASALEQTGIALRDKISLKEAAVQMEALTQVAGETSATVISKFKAIAAGAEDPKAAIDVLVGGIGSIAKAINEGGIIGAFQNIANFIRKEPLVAAQALGQQMELNSNDVLTFHDSAVGAYTAVKSASDGFKGSITDLNDQFAKSLTSMDRLKIAWETLVTDLTKGIGIPLVDALTKALDTVDKLIFGGGGIGIAGGGAGIGGGGSLFAGGANLGIGKPPSSGLNSQNLPLSEPGSFGNLSIVNNYNIGSIASGAESMFAKKITDEQYSSFQGVH